ncbi:hypothetical protein KAFR_0B03760 [Kazachstania africana CBS 2517]|uniref:Uncharacterized protein n=1 Tax=Kazachstania africana (strain ATCC 22294 / BCRC 22015 / CBS 2517 / CECT 1963 / NBRC 1671 / NRRL Y-8276) TaxID=1071382 RepID=H2AQM2_KAZAF|nr:hypothetical protein KAFR_0B03760 [Kazachstania africana CBS 2517]CCF56672.1 hypothetical protein KAFR_0B03760 [Kazachstania africana CBS 2517]
MTILVASLLLPYKPQFQIDNDNEFLSNDTIDRNLIEINQFRPKSPPIMSNNRNKSTESLPRIKSANAIDEMVLTSEEFMHNLTANATTNVTPKNEPNLTKTFSAEDFFLNSNKSTSSVNSLTNLAGLSNENVADSTANLLKNVNKSLLKSTLIKSKRPNLIHSRSTIVTPKSTALPESNSPVADFNKVKQNNFNNAKPFSVKRFPKPVPTNKNVAPPIYVEDSDLESEISDIPIAKFGGISHTNKMLKASILNRDKIDLFNKIPFNIVPNPKGNGSLKNAINQTIVENENLDPKDNVNWIGTIGIPTDELPDNVTTNIANQLKDDYDSFAIIPDDITFNGHYKNFCKQILWPTLHYQIPDNPYSKAFEDHSWNYYQRLNELYAEKIVEIYKPDDVIWIHDYHLLLLPRLIRKRLPKAKIGFFLHLSFPSSEVFRCLAHRNEILDGMLGANFIGFQTNEYLRHFLQTCNRLLMTDITSENELKYNGDIIKMNCCPIGIDSFNLTLQIFQNENVLNWKSLIRERWNNYKLIVCRDQFDRIRGLIKKLLAFERFLKLNPQYIDKVVLIQICIGNQNDHDLERQVMIIVDRINSLSSNISVSPPVVFLHQDLEFEQYLALNCEADMFWVNSLREGMNLTCHEFIVSSLEKNAPLLLSEFTGSASVLNKGIISINPWDIKDVSEKIKFALEMSPFTKNYNWKQIMKNIINHDSENWVVRNLNGINSSWDSIKERSMIFRLSYDEILQNYLDSKKRFFILKISEPPNSRMISILNDLATKNIVFVMNSFSKSTLEILYSRVPNIGLMAENGAYVRIDGSWYNIVDQVDWKNEVVKIFDDKMERLPGSYYKISDSMIKFHTENAEDKERVPSVIGDAITHINTLFDGKDIHAFVHENVINVQQTNLSINALEFIMKFYNTTTVTEPEPSSPIAVRKSPAFNFSDANNNNVNENSQNPIDFICVTGSSSPVIDPIFKYLKTELSKDENIKYQHSVIYGTNTSTYAKEHVNGLNELFIVLDKLSKV